MAGPVMNTGWMLFKAPANLGVNQAGTPVEVYVPGALDGEPQRKLGIYSIQQLREGQLDQNNAKAKHNFTTNGMVGRYMDPIPFQADNEEAIAGVVKGIYEKVVTGKQTVKIAGNDQPKIQDRTICAGAWGDAVQLVWVKLGNGKVIGQITQIAATQYTLVAKAVDNAIIVKDEEGNAFFVGGIRAVDPKKGFPAFCGGFTDVGPDPDSSVERAMTTMETAIKEGRQETRFQFAVSAEDADKVHDYFNKELHGTISYIFKRAKVGESVPCHMRWVDTIETGNEAIAEGGESLDGVRKRVHFTDLVVSVINVRGKTDAEKVRKMFHHDNEESDLTGIVVVPLTGHFEKADSPAKVEAAATAALRAATAVNKDQLKGKEFAFGITHHNTLFRKVIEVLHQDHVAEAAKKAAAEAPVDGAPAKPAEPSLWDTIVAKVSELWNAFVAWIKGCCSSDDEGGAAVEGKVSPSTAARPKAAEGGMDEVVVSTS